MGFVFGLIYLASYLFLVFLVLRLIIDWVQAFALQWRPQGIVFLVLSVSRLVTDPVLVPIRRILPVLRIGGIGIDVSLLIVFFVLTFLMRLFGMGF